MKWIIPWHLRTSWNSTNSLLGLAPRLSPKTSIHQLLYLSRKATTSVCTWSLRSLMYCPS